MINVPRETGKFKYLRTRYSIEKLENGNYLYRIGKITSGEIYNLKMAHGEARLKIKDMIRFINSPKLF